jgi:hypothetical protein
MREKLEAIAALAARRRLEHAGTISDGYSRNYLRLEQIHNGYYDRHSFVGPWTVSACNVTSDLMLVAQDWGSEDYLQRLPDPVQRDLGHNPKLPTNRNLKQLLHEAFGRAFSSVYATDAFVFVKPAGMGTFIPPKDMQTSASRFTFEEIRIVQPKMVICIGGATYNAFRLALGHPYLPIKRASYDACSIVIHGAEVHGVPHVGGTGLAATGGFSNSLRIWKSLASRLGSLSQS